LGNHPITDELHRQIAIQRQHRARKPGIGKICCAPFSTVNCACAK
jgi:hypothetical protein